jgi:glutamate racemase
VGVFDSGVGGLSVFQKIKKLKPAFEVIYFGDTAHVPYGSRSAEELRLFSDVISSFLIEQGADIIIDACNSTSAVALDYLSSKYPLPFIGVITPGVKLALEETKNKKIGILATLTTIRSKVHEKALKAADEKIEVYGVACPLFVPLVEMGMVEGPLVREVAFNYLQPLQEAGVDTVILGCTHYPYLLPVLREIMGEEVKFVDPAEEVAHILLPLLNDAAEKKGKDIFFVSGEVNSFKKTALKLLGNDARLLGHIKQIDLFQTEVDWSRIRHGAY